jgi:hypothetical protein
MYSPSKRYKYAGAPSSIPYGGWWKRWHMILGLLAGAGAVTWAFSGMLSMEPFPQKDDANDDARAVQTALQSLRGRAPLARFAAKDPRAALAQLNGAPVKELEWVSIAGVPAYFATIGPSDTRMVPVDGAPVNALDGNAMVELISNALKQVPAARVTLLSRYDRYYLDRHHVAPLPVVLVELRDAAGTRYYVDPKSARIVGGYSAANFLDRWLYHGLHSMNFPWLYNYRPAWDIVVIAFMLGGTALAVTSLVLAWQVLGRKLRLING